MDDRPGVADSSESAPIVLVTGGSGYVASYVIVALLRRGFRVHTTVRKLSREADVRATIAGAVVPGDRLRLFAADLLADGGWHEAAAGATFVLHVASPMPIGEYRNTDVIAPAREGTRRVLAAAAHAGVKRVVLTSSTAAAMPADGTAGVIDEAVWTDLPARPEYQYPRAKTLAEQDAWAFVRAQGDPFELVSVLPAQIQGPVLGRDYSASVDIIRLMLAGKLPALPRVGYSIVDVRDLAELHLLAMTRPEAAGQRFLAAGEFLWFADMARILREALGPQAAKVPTRLLPDIVVKLGALFNPELRQLRPSLGQCSTFTIAKAETMLGWRLRPARDSIVDAARSLIERGLA